MLLAHQWIVPHASQVSPGSMTTRACGGGFGIHDILTAWHCSKQHRIREFVLDW